VIFRNWVRHPIDFFNRIMSSKSVPLDRRHPETALARMVQGLAMGGAFGIYQTLIERMSGGESEVGGVLLSDAVSLLMATQSGAKALHDNPGLLAAVGTAGIAAPLVEPRESPEGREAINDTYRKVLRLGGPLGGELARLGAPRKGEVDPRGGPLTWFEELLDPQHYTMRSDARKRAESEKRERVSREELREVLGFGPVEAKIGQTSAERTRTNERDKEIADTRKLIELAFQRNQPGLALQIAEQGTDRISSKYGRRVSALLQFYRERAAIRRAMRSGEEINVE
jgi:hypothetical protein